ncbi:DUF952 domain-containing protein [uncultured Rhodoblastus sp.]|uniref:DUF952 domain-containing protein n=1 Tax=uncultured Rhodoblastus sp. TaxID=543037 RepID=UPI0025CDDE3F|nr:DUF952 domain-containing protein [uncultured Rhodoblastus sp.]
MALIYKILTAQEWEAALVEGVFAGSGVDLADGFIHFSTRAQVEETAAKYFFGRPGLLLVGVEEEILGEKLVYEISRGGAPFPHLYGPLPTALAVTKIPLPLRADGAPDFSGIFT